MQRRFVASPWPHLRDTASTRRIMLDVCLALLPAGLAGIWFFGLRALVLILVSVGTAVVSEYLFQWFCKKPVTVGDASAVVTGLLVAYNLPATAPWWVAAMGSAVAILLVKQFFGGIGQNFMNPALAARAVLTASFAGIMTSGWVMPQAGVWMQGMAGQAVDVVTSATPLALNPDQSYSLLNLFLGNVPGCIGETSKLALLLGGAYLLIRRVISWRIPLTMIVTCGIAFWIWTGTFFSNEPGVNSMVYQLLSGGLLLGAFFMATDYASSPVTPWAQVLFGVGCGLLLFLFRAFNPSLPEGCSYAILLMNIAAPLLEKVTRPRVFGEVKTRA